MSVLSYRFVTALPYVIMILKRPTFYTAFEEFIAAGEGEGGGLKGWFIQPMPTF